MKVILFGATGMVGQGVLLECLRDSGVERVLIVGRRPSGQSHPKITELVHEDFADFSEAPFAGYDACFFCLGVTSAGMSEAEYTRVTVDYTMAAARPLAKLNPGMTFVFVSGAGTDSTGKSRTMWARVKGRAENEVFALFKNAYAFRPAFIQPLDGITSRTRAYRIFYKVLAPFSSLLRRIAPKYVTTTAEVGRAMLHVARLGWSSAVLENADIEAAATAAAPI